jgi:tRNA (guanosine-2'-O-)-methyltransferase
MALAFGNEHAGLSAGLRELCDGEFAIPMYGASQSFNVSVSLAVSLHVATEARRRHVGGRGDLAPDELLRLRARYYYSDLRGARAIIERSRIEPGRND